MEYNKYLFDMTYIILQIAPQCEHIHEHIIEVWTLPTALPLYVQTQIYAN